MRTRSRIEPGKDSFTPAQSNLVSAIGGLDVSDLVLGQNLEGRTASELAKILGVNKSSVWHRINKIGDILAPLLNEPGVRIVHEHRGPFCLTEAGQLFAGWCKAHVMQFEEQIGRVTRGEGHIVSVGCVHMLLNVAATLRAKLNARKPPVELKVVPITSSEATGEGIASRVSLCHAYLTVWLVRDGEFLSPLKNYDYFKFGEEEVVALGNAEIERPVTADVIAQSLVFVPNAGIITRWMDVAMGADVRKRISTRRGTLGNAADQMNMLCTQAEDGIMLATRSYALWAEKLDSPPLHQPKIRPPRQLRTFRLDAQLRRLQIATCLVYPKADLERFPGLRSLLTELRQLRV